jgi:protein ImuA
MLWRAGQLAQSAGRVLPTGFPALSAELPGEGWPTGGLIELLCAQPGIGEMRLLRPALAAAGAQKRRVGLIGAPHVPNVPPLLQWGLSPSQLVWVRPQTQVDLLWASEQILRSQAFGAVLIWLPRVRAESLRRLQVLAQAGDSAIWLFRPSMSVRESSPAVLRLGLAPEPGWRDTLSISFLKRRGPMRGTPLVLPLGADAGPLPAFSPVADVVAEPDHAVLDRHPSAATAAGRLAAALA